jgi:Zn-dependent protease
MGDQTAEHMGRLTLNPLAHLDMFGSFILPLVSKLTTGVMFGYAKPVPYDPSKLSDRRYGPAKVAIAGPATNILLAVLAGLVLRLAGQMIDPAAQSLISYIVWINIILAFFNLMPIPPLDGHWLLMTFLPVRYYGFRQALYRYQWVFLMVFVFIVFPLFSPLLYSFFMLLTGMRLF